MELSDSARAFLRAHARGDAGWTRRRLTSWMLKRGAPAFHEHVRWEETIAQIVTQEHLTPGQGGLLEVGDLRFGSVGLFESQPEWLVERRAGGPYVLVGALANSRARLYLDAHGWLFERRGALWRCVAVSPFVYLERLVAREGERATPWWIEVPGRHGAALGMALSIPRFDAASDELAGTWADGRFCVLDGRADWPSALATTVLVRAFGAVAELLDALSDLDLPVRISPSGHATRLELSAGEASEASPAVMDEAPLTCTPETEIDEVRRMMLGRHARYMPVMTQRTLMGVISFYDVAKAVVDSQDFENRMLKAYIRDWPAEQIADD